MHDGMLYDPIKGHSQGHEPLKVRNLAIFRLSPLLFTMGAGK